MSSFQPKSEIDLRAAAGRSSSGWSRRPSTPATAFSSGCVTAVSGLLDRQVAGAGDDADAMERDLGKDRHRHRRTPRSPPATVSSAVSPRMAVRLRLTSVAERHAGSLGVRRLGSIARAVGNAYWPSAMHHLAVGEAVDRPRSRRRRASRARPAAGGAIAVDRDHDVAARLAIVGRAARGAGSAARRTFAATVMRHSAAACSSGGSSGARSAMRTGTVRVCGAHGGDDRRRRAVRPSRRCMSQSDGAVRRRTSPLHAAGTWRDHHQRGGSKISSSTSFGAHLLAGIVQAVGDDAGERRAQRDVARRRGRARAVRRRAFVGRPARRRRCSTPKPCSAASFSMRQDARRHDAAPRRDRRVARSSAVTRPRDRRRQAHDRQCRRLAAGGQLAAIGAARAATTRTATGGARRRGRRRAPPRARRSRKRAARPRRRCAAPRFTARPSRASDRRSPTATRSASWARTTARRAATRLIERVEDFQRGSTSPPPK